MGEKGSGIFYGWWVVATCFLSLLFAGGALFYALPVFLKPLAAEFGWDRGDISAGISATFIGQVFVAPLLGALISRYGARVVMIPAAILAGLSLLLLTWLDHLLEFHVVRVLMGVALVGLAFIPATVTIFGWFRKNRGRALGITLMAFPLGGLVFTPLTAGLIARLGWQTTFTVLGLSIWVILLPVLFFLLRNDPKDLGLQPDGELPDAEPAGEGHSVAADRDLSPREAAKTGRFWTLSIMYVILYASLIGMLVHQFPHITDLGYTPQTAGFVVSAILAISAAGGLFFGWASDRLDARYLAACGWALGSVGVIVLTLSASLWALGAYVVLMGVAYGGTDPLLAVVVRRTFGANAYAVVFGFYQSLVCVGGFIGGTALGYVYDAALSYRWGFAAAAVGFALSAALILSVRSASAVMPGPAKGA